jgi:hypothetical protein
VKGTKGSLACAKRDTIRALAAQLQQGFTCPLGVLGRGEDRGARRIV